MVIHKCEICEREFKKKCHLKDHLENRKKPCKKAETFEELQKEHNKIKKELEKIKEEYEKNKLYNSEKVNILEKEKKEYKDILEKENDALKKINEELKKEIKDNKNVIINNNYGDTITNNFNLIKIIDHGKENYDKINIKQILKEKTDLPPLNYISTIIYYIHCNNEHPEYQNIMIPDKSRNKAMIYFNGKWINVDKNTTMETLFNKIIYYYDNESEKSSNPEIYNNFNREVQKVIGSGKLYSKKNKKGAIDNIENVLYDNREIIKSIKYKECDINDISNMNDIYIK
jgi:hypothetical protein